MPYLEHPDITRIERTGYPLDYHPTDEVGVDALGNTVFEGDEIIEFDGEIYLVDEISFDTVEILTRHGAERKIAK